MAITLEDELVLLTSLLEEPLEVMVDDGFFVECSEHDSCRTI